ncbi:MAG: hypothetical protein U0R66_01220 [Mycobacterium sp.]
MSEEDRTGYQSVFRETWRERRSSGNQLGGLIRQPRWVNAGLLALAGLLAVGAVAGATVTVARNTSFPAVSDGATASAVRGPGPAPTVGSPARFRGAADTIDAVVVGVSPTEVIAQLSRPAPPSGGQLLVPAAREPLFSLLIPRLG